MAAPSWQPDQAGLQQIVGLLTEFQKPGTDQAQVLAVLEQCKAFPDFNNYLAYIFASGEGLAVEVRQGAGLLLKNNLRAAYPGVSPEFRSFIKAALLGVLGHASRPLRHTAGTCVVAIVGLEGLLAWPELVAAAGRALESGDASRAEGALDTLYKLAEERPQELQPQEMGPAGEPGPSPIDPLVPPIMALFAVPQAELRALALGLLNLLADVSASRAIVEGMDRYVAGLFGLAQDASPAVRKAVCTGLVQMLFAAPERLQPSMPALIEYMLKSTEDGEEEVAVESCEFWSAICDSQVDAAVLRPFLPRVIPVLLKNMVYDEYDDEVQEAELAEERGLAAAAAGSALPEDRDDQLKPYIHKGGGHGEGGGSGDGAGEGDEDGDGGGDDDEEVARWNLRRCSAAGLDMLSTVFGDELLPIILPVVQERLQGSDWRARESAILALGAVSEGCATGLQPHLPGMVAMLLPALSDARPLVRCIACWSLTRYSKWVLERADAGQRTELDGIVAAICGRVLDHNRRVQEAACSALATLVEEAGARRVSPYCPALLAALAAALQRYGRRTLRNAYDVLSTLAEHAAPELRVPEHAALVLPLLFGKLAALPEGDRELLPLMECIASVSQAAGPALEPHAEAAFFRCVSMVQRAQEAAASGAFDPGEAAEFVVCSLDVLGGLAEGLGPSVESLVGGSHLVDVLLRCVADPSPDVRQSSFALVGDLARACAPHLRRAARELIGAALATLEPCAITRDAMSACNNACWSIGELAIKLSPEAVAPCTLPALESLLRILSVPGGALPRSLIENSAISLGRLAWVCPEPLAPHASHFVGPWCAALRGMRDDLEKQQAFLGLSAVLQRNPQAGASAFSPLCEALASWRALPDGGLRGELAQLIQGYKAQLVAAGQWELAMGSVTPAVRQKLSEMFQV